MKGHHLSSFSLLAVLLLISCSLTTAPGTEEAPSGTEREEPPDLVLPTLTALPDLLLPTLPAPSDLLLPTLPAPPASSLCTDDQPPFVTGLEVLQPPQLDEPAARIPFRDPVFGTCLVRVTDRSADLAVDDTSAGLKNEYSRVQSFNADGSLILVRGLEATWYLYSAATLQPLGRVPLDVDPRWSTTDPALIYFISETRLMAYDVRTGASSLVHDFASEFPGSTMVWTRYKGSPSADGRWWGLMAEDENWLTSAYLVYDQLTDQVVASRSLTSWPDALREVESVTISPLGNYFLAQMDFYCEQGQLGTEEAPCGLMVYDRNLENGRGVLRIVGHSDIALDPSGREVFVFQDVDTDNLSMVDLATGVITPLLPLDFSYTGFGLHISGRALQFPGWAVISTHDGDTASHIWMDDSVFAVELVTSGRVLRLAHTHSLVDETMEHDYWAEPQASVDQAFTRVVFTTNWGRSGSGEVEMYLLEIPPGLLEMVP